jgi:pyrimidine deaminase RibD-like protein
MEPKRLNGDHKEAMRHALGLAGNSPPKPTNFRVGAMLVRLKDNLIIAEGYTLELPGNTHAEECCLIKLAEQYSTTEEGLATVVSEPHILYTTVEPCSKRLSGKLPCAERIRRQRDWIKKVYVGVQEPDTFVSQNDGRRMLEDAGVEVIHVTGLEKEILEVATAGHVSE